MSMWNRIKGMFIAAGRSLPGPADDYWYGPLGTPSASGIEVTPDSALQVPTVLACVRVLAETVASLPLHVYRRLPNGGKQREPNHPLYDLLHSAPNAWQTSFEWREMMIGHLCLRGNAYSRIVPGRRGWVDQLIPLHPDRIKIYLVEDARLRYEHRPQQGPPVSYTQDEILHIRGLSSDGYVGLSPIALARETIGLAVAQERHGARFFKNNARPGVVLEHPGKMKPESKIELRKQWEHMHAGSDNAHRTAVLEEGMKANQLGLTNEDSQWLESRGFQDKEIARIFRVPPHMVGILDRATFSNIEHQGLDFTKHTIRPWLVRIEQRLRGLLIAPRTFFAEFLIDGLLRGDSKARSAFYQLAILSGWMTRNEVRVLENLNPAPPGSGLDDFLTPLNMKEGQEQESSEGKGRAAEQHELAFQILAADAAGRIARAEYGEAGKRLKHAAEDPERFVEWLESFYKDHHGYVTRSLDPLVRAWKSFHSTPNLPIDPQAIADGVIEQSRSAWNVRVKRLGRPGCNPLRAVRPQVLLAGWQQDAAAEIAALIEYELKQSNGSQP